MAHFRFVNGKFAIRMRRSGTDEITVGWFGPYRTLGIAKRWQKHYAKQFPLYTPFVVTKDEWDKEVA